MRKAGVVGVVAVLAFALLPVLPAEAASRRTSVLLKKLTVAAEQPAGYDRMAFRHWIDADGDGCDTRREVLIEEAIGPVRVTGRCDLSGGVWRSMFDGVTTRDSSTFDVDHLIPLAEAWRSGAASWNAQTRERFANDLGIAETLIAVSASSNRSKGDRDPADWLPPAQTYRCDYVMSWVTVKYRWRLSVDRAERQAIRAVVRSCGNPRITVPPRAPIGRE